MANAMLIFVGLYFLTRCSAEDSRKPFSVLWLGNSYTWRNDVPGLVSQLAEAAGLPLVWDSHAESSWTWRLHAASQETLDKIAGRVWDAVVLQEQSTRPAYEESAVCNNSAPYLSQLVRAVRARSQAAAIQLYLTWGRPHGEPSLCSQDRPQFCSFSSMQDRLTSTYQALACTNTPARLAPVGEAFRQLWGGPEFLTLYSEGGEDHHASQAGSYLAAVTHFSALFNRSAVGLAAQGGLDKETAARLQEAGSRAWAGAQWQWTDTADCSLCLCDC